MDGEKQLFSDYTYESFFSDNITRMRAQIERYTGEYLATRNLEELYQELEDRYSLHFPVLSGTISKGEFDKNKPIVKFRVTFDGDRRFFEAKSDKQWTNEIPPRAEIGRNELIFTFSTSDKPIIHNRMEILRSPDAMPTPENINRWPHIRLAQINKWLDRFRGDVGRLNSSIHADMRSKIGNKLNEWTIVKRRQEELERQCNN